MYTLEYKPKDGITRYNDAPIITVVVKNVRQTKSVIIYALTEEEADFYIYLPNTFYVKIRKIKEVG